MAHHKIWFSALVLSLTASPCYANPDDVESAHLLPPFHFSGHGEVLTGSSPDNSYSNFVLLLNGARRNIRLAAYMLRSPGIAFAIEKAAKRNVKVTVLLDGWTVARPKAQKIDELELYWADRIARAGGRVLYLRSDSGKRDDRRFRFLHAKYAVIDDETIFISSENFANSGFSPNGTIGSRGWVVGIRNRELAAAYAKVFDIDVSRNPKFNDIAPYGHSPEYTYSGSGKAPEKEVDTGDYKPQKSRLIRGTFGFERVLSPDDSLVNSRAILGAIREARESIEIESLSFSPHWGTNNDTIETHPNPLAEAVLNAARRGVRVRVLVNPLILPKKEEPETTEPKIWAAELAASVEEALLAGLSMNSALEIASRPNTKDNYHLLKYFREISKKERLDLKAYLFKVRETGIRILHNKGMIVDGSRTLISSINWVENSVKNNREVAVIIDNRAVASYYKSLFELDWDYFRDVK